MEFEKAPFKLTSEMVAVMGGIKSGLWKHFRKLCIQGYVEACRCADKFMLMVDVAYPGNGGYAVLPAGAGLRAGEYARAVRRGPVEAGADAAHVAAHRDGTRELEHQSVRPVPENVARDRKVAADRLYAFLDATSRRICRRRDEVAVGRHIENIINRYLMRHV